jgi:hypothetical protein
VISQLFILRSTCVGVWICLTSLRNENKNETSTVAGLAHWLKGQCSGIGIWKVRSTALEIQDIAADRAADGLQSVEERIHRIKQLMSGMKDTFVDAKEKFRTFYREEHEETVW